MKKRGFTLIELLVVISVVSFLSSIILSQVNHARTKATAVIAVQQLQILEQAMIAAFIDDGFTTWPKEELTPHCFPLAWCELQDVADDPNYSLGTYMPDIPFFDWATEEIKYDHDDDLSWDPNDPCNGILNGPFLVIVDTTHDFDLYNAIDEIVDGGDGLNCGKWTHLLVSSHLFYRLGLSGSDF